MVGDNRAVDVDGALAAGLQAIHVCGGTPTDAVEMITRVADLRI